ncbi:hypothetical protein DEDE109153_01615 [Deinococcus deserti]
MDRLLGAGYSICVPNSCDEYLKDERLLCSAYGLNEVQYNMHTGANENLEHTAPDSVYGTGCLGG